MTSHGRRLDGLVSLDEDSEDELLLDTDESSGKYLSLGLDKSLSEPMRIDGVHSLVTSLSLDIPHLQVTNESEDSTPLPTCINHQKRKGREKVKHIYNNNNKYIDGAYLGNERTVKIDEARMLTKLEN